jgi:hypothetical protein
VSFTIRRGGRPKKGKGPSVEELLIVTDMRRENRPTREIIDKLMARGLSEATALRRLRLAESSKGADMDLNHQDRQTMVVMFKSKPEAES